MIRAWSRFAAGWTLASARRECRRAGHLWDSERPAGALHERDICWRCDAVRPHRQETR